MKEIICNPYYETTDSDQFYNEFTKEMDEYLVHGNNRYCNGTYIMLPWNPYISVLDDDTDEKDVNLNKNLHCPIRYPGATRGHIEVDKDNIIVDIRLYEDTCFKVFKHYKPEVLEILDKYKGCKLIFPNKDK